MKTFELIAPCHFGLEAVLKKEILDLGYEISLVEDGRVTFIGDDEAICRANVFLRTAERVLLKAGSFKAETFEELFQGTRNIPWEDFIPEDGKFWVAKASSIKSKLFSPSDIQSIMKKAMVERLKNRYGVTWFPENGASYPLRVFLYKDLVTVASTCPSMASSITFSTYRNAASPHMADTCPRTSSSMETRPMSSTSMVPWVKTASLTSFTARTFISSWPAIFSAASRTQASPTTMGLHSSYMDWSASAFTVISGPILAGSPMVIPIIFLSSTLTHLYFMQIRNKYGTKDSCHNDGSGNLCSGCFRYR